MIRAFYNARSGLNAHQEHMNVLSNNMANVNTVGFKSQRVSFTDLVYQNINRETAENPAMIGHGVRINKTDLIMGQGALTPTDRRLDFALTRQGDFFAVENAAGDVHFTRAGNFVISQDEAGSWFLSAPNGDRILNSDMEHVELVLMNEDGEEDETGFLNVDINEIGIFRFDNPYGLLLMGNNRFAESGNSGEAEMVEPEQRQIIEGVLESANVDIGTEMVRVIEASRAFGLNSRMVQVADEIEQTVNALR